MTEIFYTRVNYWIYTSLIITAICFTGIVFLGGWRQIGLMLLIMLPLLANMFYVRYTITDHDLSIRFGVFINLHIQIDSIKIIKSNFSVFRYCKGLDLPQDRIEIIYNTRKSVIISPQDKKDFVEMLKQINPAIVTEV